MPSSRWKRSQAAARGSGVNGPARQGAHVEAGITIASPSESRRWPRGVVRPWPATASSSALHVRGSSRRRRSGRQGVRGAGGGEAGGGEVSCCTGGMRNGRARSRCASRRTPPRAPRGPIPEQSLSASPCDADEVAAADLAVGQGSSDEKRQVIANAIVPGQFALVARWRCGSGESLAAPRRGRRACRA